MQKTLIPGMILVIVALTGRSQSMPDPARLAKMSPAELQAYKQQMLKAASEKAKQLAAQYDFKLDETTLPDFEVRPPVKDLKRLALIPGVIPSMAQLAAEVTKSEHQLQTLAPPPVVQEVKTMTEKQDGPTLQGSAIGQWMNDNPVQALLLQMASTLKSSGNVTAWNNLAALYNMTGMEHKAVPILQRLLKEAPNNAMLLNNLGQAYLGLGDLGKAREYLQQCLAVDDLNPEANHSLGMIAAFAAQADEAMKYFENELQVAMRRSTLARIKKMGRTVNLAAIRNSRKDIPHRDLFTEIGLDKFRIPTLPTSSDKTAEWRTQTSALMKSIAAEFGFWLQAANLSDEERKQDGRRSPGLYADLATELLSEHGKEYAPLLSLFGKEDFATLDQMGRSYMSKLGQAVCPQPPIDPEGGEQLILAYAKKCCDLHKPIIDAYMSEQNAFIGNRLDPALANWKSYINGWVDIVSLAPSNAAKKSVYKVVADYLGFLISVLQTAAAVDPPGECRIKMTTGEADAVIAAKHDLDLQCPEWLKLKFDISVFTLKADCSKFSVEGGEGLVGGYEKNFKTGVCTLSAGIGENANFRDLVKASLKQMAYVSFDNNNQLTDFGVKGSSTTRTTIAGLEGGYSLGVHSGFNAAVNGTGILKSLVNLSTQQ